MVFLFVIVCDVAQCDKKLGHCVLGKLNKSKECGETRKNMWTRDGGSKDSACKRKGRKIVRALIHT